MLAHAGHGAGHPHHATSTIHQCLNKWLCGLYQAGRPGYGQNLN